MLAVHPAMDALRRSPHGSDRHLLLREPSAEDLDAAHQLVSSARGERMNSHQTHDGQVSETLETSSHQSTLNTQSSDSQRAVNEAVERETPGNFSQVCRYVSGLGQMSRFCHAASPLPFPLYCPSAP